MPALNRTLLVQSSVYFWNAFWKVGLRLYVGILAVFCRGIQLWHHSI